MDLGAFALQLQGAHKLLAMFTKQPAMQLSDDEAKKLAQAVKNVLKHHQINIAPSTLAYVQLIGVAAVIYTPRFALIMAMQKMKAEQAQQAADLEKAGASTTLIVPDPSTPMQ